MWIGLTRRRDRRSKDHRFGRREGNGEERGEQVEGSLSESDTVEDACKTTDRKRGVFMSN